MSLTQVPNSLLALDGGALSYRNKIINGCGWIDQRNGNSPVTVNSTANTFGPDRWAGFGANTDGVFAFQGTKGVWDATGKGMPSCVFAQTSTADSAIGAAQSYGIRYAVEGQDIAAWHSGTAQAATVTLSFRVYSTKAGTHCVALSNSANTRSYVATYTVNQASTWEYKTITVPLDTTGTWLTDNGAGLKLFWNLGAGSNYTAPAANTWYGAAYQAVAGCQNVIDTVGAVLAITDVQLELGPSATVFENRPIATELALCQRYYEESGVGDGSVILAGYNAGGSAIYANYLFKVTKRAAPTVAVVGTWGVSNCAQPTTYQPGVNGCFLSSAITTTGSGYTYNSAAGNKLTITAEL